MFMGPTLDFRKFLPPQHPFLQLASVADPAPIVPPAPIVNPPMSNPKAPEMLTPVGPAAAPALIDPERTTPVVIPPGPTSRKEPEVKTPLAPGSTPDERTKPLPSTFQEEVLRMFKDPKMQANLAQMVKGFGGAKAAPAPPTLHHAQLKPIGPLPDRGAGALAGQAMKDLERFDLRRKQTAPPEAANYDILAAQRQRRRRRDDD